MTSPPPPVRGAPPVQQADPIDRLRVPASVEKQLAAVGERLTIGGFYDAAGSAVYHSLGWRDPELPAMVSLLRAVKGPILELAAGSGRLTMALLARNKPVTALDNSPHMLDILSSELAAQSERVRKNCSVVLADMTDFELEDTYAAVVLNATSITILDEPRRRKLYERVRSHLDTGGLFLLNTCEVIDREEELQTYAIEVDGRITHDLYLYYPAGGSYRTVTIVPRGLDTGEVTMLTDRVLVLPPEQLEDELQDEGFDVSRLLEWTDEVLKHTVLGASS